MYESQLIAERIRGQAKSIGVTQKALLESAGLGRNTMAHLDGGKSIASDSLGRVADFLGCSVDYLLGRTNSPGVVPVGFDLSEDERELIGYFRQLNSTARRHVLNCAEDERDAAAEKGETSSIA